MCKSDRVVTAPRGVALIVSLIFLALFACLALAITTAADMNLSAARNRVASDQAAALAETGLLLVQQELGGLSVPATHNAADVHKAIATRLVAVLATSTMVNAGAITYGSAGVVLPPITAVMADGRAGTVEAQIQADGGALDRPTITVQSVGRFDGAVRTVTYRLGVRNSLDGVGKYGIASRSPIEMRGSPTILGANAGWEGSVLSATSVTLDAVTLTGHVEVSGDVAVSGDGARIDTHGSVTIGGEEIYGAPEPEWPTVNTSRFSVYATNVFDGVTSGERVLTNVRVPPGTNPTFNSDVVIQGVLYIESPNRVTFSGNATVRGTIVMQEHAAGLAANEIFFAGNVESYAIDTLPPEPQFAALRGLTGTFLLAPGAHAKFAGNFGTVNGWMVASGYDFTGNAGGTVCGTIVNLDDTYFRIDGDVDLRFDRSGDTDNPAGLVATYSLASVRGSYSD